MNADFTDRIAANYTAAVVYVRGDERKTGSGSAEHESFESRLPAEVQQQSDTTSGSFEVIEQLRDRIILNVGRGLDFDQHDSVHDQVGVEPPDHLAAETNVQRHFLSHVQSGGSNDDPEGTPVDRFRKPIPELAVYLEEAPDDCAGDFCVRQPGFTRVFHPVDQQQLRHPHTREISISHLFPIAVFAHAREGEG